MKQFILIVLVFGVLIGVVSIPVMYPVAKLVRSQQHLTTALEAKEEGDDLRANSRLKAAYNLVKDNPEINVLLGPYGAAVYDPNALNWWITAAEDGLLEFEDIVDMIEYGVRINQADTVRPYLFDLTRSHPDDPQVQALQVRFLQRDRRPDETRVLAENLVRQGNRELDVFATYVRSTLTQPELPEEDREEALANLKSMSTEGGDIGIFSLRTLLQVWGFLDDQEKALVKERLLEHESSGLEDKLGLLSLEKRDGLDEATLLERARSIYAEYAEDEEVLPSRSQPKLAVFVDWLTREGHPAIALEYLQDPERIKDPRVFFVRQLALIQNDDPAGARDASFVDNPLTPGRNFVTRAMAQSVLGETDKILPNLELAVENAHVDEVRWLEQILLQRGYLDLVVKLYENLERKLAQPVTAQIRLLAYYKYLGRELDVRRVAQDISLEDLSGLLADQLSVLYDIILYRYDFDQIRRHVESVVAQYPDLIETRLYLAFVYALSDQPGLSTQLIDGWESFPQLKENPNFASMLAYIFARSGDMEKARELASVVDRERMLDLERFLLRDII